MPPVKKTLTFSSEDERALLTLIDKLVEDGEYANFSECCKQAIRQFLTAATPPGSTPTLDPQVLESYLEKHLEQYLEAVTTHLRHFEQSISQQIEHHISQHLMALPTGVPEGSSEASPQWQEELSQLALQVEQLSQVLQTTSAQPSAAELAPPLLAQHLQQIQNQLTTFEHHLDRRVEQHFTEKLTQGSTPEQSPQTEQLLSVLAQGMEQLTEQHSLQSVEHELAQLREWVEQIADRQSPSVSDEDPITSALNQQLQLLRNQITHFEQRIDAKLAITDQVAIQTQRLEAQLHELAEKVSNLSITQVEESAGTQSAVEGTKPDSARVIESTLHQDSIATDESAPSAATEVEAPKASESEETSGSPPPESAPDQSSSPFADDPVLSRIGSLLDRF